MSAANQDGSRINTSSSSNTNNNSSSNNTTTTTTTVNSGNMPSAPLHVNLTAEAVASLPPPGLSGPTSLVFSPLDQHSKRRRYLAFVSSTGTVLRTVRSPPALYRPLTTGTWNTASTITTTTTTTTASCTERVLQVLDLTDLKKIDTSQPLIVSMRSSKRRILEQSNGDGSTAMLLSDNSPLSLEERLRRERQRLSASSATLTQFTWMWPQKTNSNSNNDKVPIRILIPARGSLWIQDGWQKSSSSSSAPTMAHPPPPAPTIRCIYDRLQSTSAAVDPQLSPDGSLVAWTSEGEVFVQSTLANGSKHKPIQISFGAIHTDTQCISHGVADFVAQEEMDRYRGFWWHPESSGLLLTRVDESKVPVFRIMHSDSDSYTSEPISTGSTPYEDHRYPFAGKCNPSVALLYVPIDRESIQSQCIDDDDNSNVDAIQDDSIDDGDDPVMQSFLNFENAQLIAEDNWKKHCVWFESPREAPEYLARVYWLPDNTAAAQWQSRLQNVSVIVRLDLTRHKAKTMLVERSDTWINLHHMFRVLPRPIHPQECGQVERNVPPMPYPLPSGSFSFIMASERTGFLHLYLYTYVPGINGEHAVLLRTITAGEWMVESIVGIDAKRDVVYFMGTYDSALEKHLYALPITNRRASDDDSSMDSDEGMSSSGVRRGFSKVMNAFSGKSGRTKGEVSWSPIKPLRLTVGCGMHSVIMDDSCEVFCDTSSDIDRPTSVKLYKVPDSFGKYVSSQNSTPQTVKLMFTLYDAKHDDRTLADMASSRMTNGSTHNRVSLQDLPAPELITFPTTDGSEMLHAAVYRPDSRIYGPGPYPLVCAVYGGPHVQRVNRSWSQCADMRAQRLRSLGFCVVKCDNRGSSRRGLAFESAISRRLGRSEVLDQVAAVRQLTLRGLVDPSRVGIYGWSYGGYLAAMCLCRAPDVFHAAVAGAPVTSWDGYDTHYTERYMGLPSDNPAGYRESAVLDHVTNMRGKLMIVHGLIDENVHFRHTTRLINKLIAAGKEYDLLIFPDERHSPRRLRDRIYMEQRISDFFLRSLTSHSARESRNDTSNSHGSSSNGGNNGHHHNNNNSYPSNSSGRSHQNGSSSGGGPSQIYRSLAGHL